MKSVLLSVLLTMALLSVTHAQTNPPGPDASFFGQRTVPQATPTPSHSSFFENDSPLPAAYLVTATEDFVVNVYLNGKPVPMAQREVLKEVYGSIVEKTKIEVKPGDWIVFNVANDRLRWGTCYFGVAGLGKDGKPVFVSRLSDPRWTCCDDLAKVDEFITQKDSKGETVRAIPKVWGDGPKLMSDYAFKGWNGDPIWGKTPSTWIKFVYR